MESLFSYPAHPLKELPPVYNADQNISRLMIIDMDGRRNELPTNLRELRNGMRNYWERWSVAPIMTSQAMRDYLC
jgi:hypothetical protein